VWSYCIISDPSFEPKSCSPSCPFDFDPAFILSNPLPPLQISDLSAPKAQFFFFLGLCRQRGRETSQAGDPSAAMDLPESSVSRADEGRAPRRVGPVDREELVRVIEQSLYSLGYRRAAAALEAESGVPLYPPDHGSLLLDVMAGRWDACAETVRAVAGVGDADRAVAEFLLWRAHYLELLGTGGDAGLRRAREVLRRRIAPLGVDRRCVHCLACAMVSCDGAVAPDAVVGWRIAVFLDLVEVLPPWFHVPSGRLEHLVESAVTKQVASCIYHNLPDEITLFQDHKCHEQHIPSKCAQVRVKQIVRLFISVS